LARHFTLPVSSRNICRLAGSFVSPRHVFLRRDPGKCVSSILIPLNAACASLHVRSSRGSRGSLGASGPPERISPRPRPPPPPPPPRPSLSTQRRSTADCSEMNAPAAMFTTRCVAPLPSAPCVGRALSEYPFHTSNPPESLTVFLESRKLRPMDTHSGFIARSCRRMASSAWNAAAGMSSLPTSPRRCASIASLTLTGTANLIRTAKYSPASPGTSSGRSTW